jgi:hypothetical protein
LDAVVLGGTSQRGDWNTTSSLEDVDRILEGVGEIFPALAEAPMVLPSNMIQTISKKRYL